MQSIKIICLTGCIIPFLISCSWLEIVETYKTNFKKTYEIPKTALEDTTLFNSINGKFPDEIYIKTPTQTYSRDYQFNLVDGLIYYKGRSPKLGPSQWELFGGTGLPHSDDKNLIVPNKIVHITSDIDSLMVLSDEGRVFGVFFDDLLRAEANTWYWAWGFPGKVALELNATVQNYRGWTSGTRRGDILWYEDIFGNEHHYGTMGIESLYFLTEDGSEIRFTDTGLPSDFSRSIGSPERGRFIARNISASGSTIFLINDAGEMYTRLIDFDTMGGNPMFFKYTYKNIEQKGDGTQYWTNFTEWGLPAEDWIKQKEIPLLGKARITKYISIMQNGRGNDAREMRVAGLNAEGQTGFYIKQLLDKTWNFVKAPLVLNEEYFLDPLLDKDSLRGPTQEYAYKGVLTVNGKGLSLSIDDLLLSEGYCTLKISYNNETALWRIHPVEVWSYFPRYNPGHDSSPKQFFITFEETETQKIHNSSLSTDFQNILADIFYEKELSLFSSWAEATTDFFHMEIPQTIFGDLAVTLVSSELAKKIPENALTTEALPFYRSFLYKLPLWDSFLTDFFTLPTQKFSVADRSLIEKFILRNENLLELMQNERDIANSYNYNATVFRNLYDATDFVTTLTLLRLIDTPKIKTITMHMGDTQKWNDALNKRSYNLRKLLYPNFEALLNYRILGYKQLLSDINVSGTATLNPSIRSSIDEYFDMILLPTKVNGSSELFNSNSAILERLTIQPLFSGFIVTDTKSNSSVLIELENPIKTIIKAAQNNSTEFYSDVIIHDTKNLQPKKGRLRLDSNGILITRNFILEDQIVFQSF